MQALQEIYPDLEQFSPDALAVVSEPLSDLSDLWEEIPESTAITVHRGAIQQRAFKPRVTH